MRLSDWEISAVCVSLTGQISAVCVSLTGQIRAVCVSLTGQIRVLYARHNVRQCYVKLKRGEYILRVDVALFCDFFVYLLISSACIAICNLRKREVPI